MGRNGLRGGALHSYLRQVEGDEIKATLSRNGWNVAATARELGVSRIGLTLRLRTLGIERPTEDGDLQADSAPAELAMRETTLYRFTDPADRAAVLRVGRMLHLYALEQPPAKDSDAAIHAALRAAARDLRNLQGFLEWVYREGDQTELGVSAGALTELAHSYGKELGRIATSIEGELGGVTSPGRGEAQPAGSHRPAN